MAAQIKTIELVSTINNGHLAVLVTDDDDFDFFAHKFCLRGAPVFLLLQRGVEISRFLGTANLQELQRFISQYAQPQQHR